MKTSEYPRVWQTGVFEGKGGKGEKKAVERANVVDISKSGVFFGDLGSFHVAL
jgi:hypothetical protein